MSDTKLTVMHKKFIKLLRTPFPKYFKQKALLLRIMSCSNTNFINRAPLSKQQRPKFRKVGESAYKNFSKRKEKPVGRIFINISRYLSASINTNFSQYSKVNSFWKILFPHKLEGKRRLSTIWIKTANEIAIPKLSRGINGKQNRWLKRAESFDPLFRNVLEQKNKHKIGGDVSRQISEQYSETANQRLQTEASSKDKSISNFKQEREKLEEKWFKELLPPPQKCRLSCPLPPPEFYPKEVNEYHPNYQSPNVKFLSLPEEFLPKQKVTAQNSANFNSMKIKEKFSAKERKVFHSSYNLDLPELMLKKIKNKKNYLNLMNVKSQLYKPQDEDEPKMKALLFEPISLKLNYDAVNVPTKILKNEVLVQVVYSGVCGTDFFITEGKVSYGDNLIILGHEISGKVYAAGSGVTHVKPGDNIVVNAYTSCSFCRYCSRGLYSTCANEGLNNAIGITKNGGWAEFVVVKKSQVHKIPEQLDLDQAVLIQPLSCVLSAMSKLNISHEMRIFIQGLGLSGCLWASVLHSRGHKNVFVSEKSERKKMQFDSLNINYTFIPPEDIVKQEADIIIECTGSPLSIEKSFNILNPSGQICFFEKPNPMTEVRCIPYEIIQKEITVFGNAGNSFRFSEAIHLAMAMGLRYLDFEKLGVRTFDLEDYKEAFHMKKSGKVNKIIFKFDR